MLNSTVLEVAIGLVLCFASVSLIVSSISEAISSALNLRARNLLAGVKALLNDPSFNGLALDLYNHALVNPRSNGTATGANASLKCIPSYINSVHFASGLIDALQRANWGKDDALTTGISEVKDDQIRKMLEGMAARASGDVQKFHAELASWFDAGMARVAGVYKRKTQLICFIIAFLIAAVFNVDAIYAAHFDSLANAPDAIKNLHALPIGWVSRPTSFLEYSITVIGWSITASATLFGAPFWFDTLQKFVQLRGTGDKPIAKA
jgi:hypothetical protein